MAKPDQETGSDIKKPVKNTAGSTFTSGTLLRADTRTVEWLSSLQSDDVDACAIDVALGVQRPKSQSAWL